MTYEEFKTYLAGFLWKTNDLDLKNNLDSLILIATSELDRVLDITRREAFSTYVFPATIVHATVPLPTDFKQMITASNGRYTFKNNSTQQLMRQRISYTGPLKPAYSITAENSQFALQLVGAAQKDDTLDMVYRSKLPDYKADDVSWLADDYLDLLTYTVLKHCAPFLREDERVQTWATLATQAMQTVITEDRHNIAYGGADTHISTPY